jgi:hypothetical protein
MIADTAASSTMDHGWTPLADQPLVLVRSYSFGPATANGLVVGLPEGKLMVISPPLGLTSADIQALAGHGEVVALLENNGLHHLGLSPFRAAFPAAVTYAAPRAAARIRKKGKDVGPVAPLTALAALLGDRVSVVEIDGDKVGDVLVRVRTNQGTLLYVGDLIANMPRLPGNWLARLLFRLTDSGPGLKVFGLFFKFFVRNRVAALHSLIKEVEANPPAILVPAHGDVLARNDLQPTLLALLRAAL